METSVHHACPTTGAENRPLHTTSAAQCPPPARLLTSLARMSKRVAAHHPTLGKPDPDCMWPVLFRHTVALLHTLVSTDPQDK